MVGDNACRVDIPGDWKVWPIISVRHLVKAPSTPDTFGRASPPQQKPQEAVKEVEEILDTRMMKGRKEFFVKWAGLQLTLCEWKLPQDIQQARYKIDAFEQDLSSRAPGKCKRQDSGESTRKKR
jgi:hypothetical protein